MDQISRQEVMVYQFLRDHPESWYSNREIAAATQLVRRTVSQCTRHFFDLGLVEKVHVFPGHRFRFFAATENQDYVERLEQIAAVLGDFTHAP